VSPSKGYGQKHFCSKENIEISYQIRYEEQNHRSGRNPWSLRHTGVYHHHTSDSDLWIILNPIKESLVETRLLELERLPADSAEINRICKNSFLLHILLFSSYFGNWRWYFRSLGDDFEKKVFVS
jgi:hypothetical protein